MSEVESDEREFAIARRRMVDEQLRARGIQSRRVLEAMERVPRHVFVEPALVPRAYGDHALPIAEGQSISQPWIVARMLEWAEIEPHHRVLEIGTGTGYQTAILSLLADRVFSIERIASLLRGAREQLDRMGCRNVALRHGDGSLGWQDFAPYDRVLAAAAAPHVPEALKTQLADGGVLVIPVGDAENQVLQVLRRRGSGVVVERRDACRFVPLVGRDAWRDDPSAR